MAQKERLELLLQDLDSAQNLEALQAVTVELRDYFDVLHVIYHWVDSLGEQYGCGTYSGDWVDRYLEKNYLRTDPVIIGCFQRFHPVDWKQLDWSSKAARQFQKEAMAYGVGNQGYSIPIRGPNGQFALFTLNASCDDAAWARFIEANGHDLILIGHFFNRKALEFEATRIPDHNQSLSPREVDAMTLLAQGLSRAQVAEKLSISEHTVRVYIESARFKLGALNTTHAVARAIGRGLIVV
ncbi:MAG: LuxR family transcriptional regulator [Marinibacterium sp.]|nr:LuxR family transcriptional regulator [Marinibacterium sp.]